MRGMEPLSDKTRRAPSLDMLRGYAALVVVLAHTSIAGIYKVEPTWTYLKWTPLRVIWAGHQAVILFFVLSGFALAHMWSEARPHRYLSFAVARVVRLYPPFVASLVVAIIGYALLERTGHVWQKGWLNTAHPVVDRQMIIDHLKMIGSYDTSPINPPMWSIVHEMRISLAFPVIALAVYYLRFKAVILAVLLSVCIGLAALAGSPGWWPWPVQDGLLTTHYATFFVVGAWFYSKRADLVARAESLTPNARIVWWIVALAIFAYPFDNPWSMGARIFGDLGSAVGAFLLMALSFTIKDGAIFRLGHWLGKISFSLYLNHYVVMSAAMILLHDRFGSPAVWICTVAGAVSLAVVMNKVVEQPSQSLARFIRKRLGSARAPARASIVEHQ